LFLDDVQWANTASLDLLRSLLQSQFKMPLLIVTCRRSQTHDTADPSITLPGVPEHHLSAKNSSMRIPGRKKLLEALLTEFEKDESVNLTYIDLTNLDLESISRLVADILLKDPLEVKSLSKITFSHSNGNVFHLLQLLRLLVERGIVKKINQQWTWDDDEVEQGLRSADSVLDLVAGTIKSLPRPVQEALKIASCLGSEVDSSAIDIVLSTSCGPLLDQAANEGLLVFSPQYGGYRFGHDWIRHAAYSLIPEEERADFHLKLGQRLWRSSSPSALDQNILLIVSLLNVGGHLVKEKRQRYKLAELCLKAGRKALELPSFSDAATFWGKGIEYLPKNCWRENYKLALDLYSNNAEVETLNGNFNVVAVCIGEVVQHGANLDDKIQAYTALINSMHQQDDMKEATSVCVDVVNKLGERLPLKASKLNVMMEFVKVRLGLLGKTDEEILALPPMTNHRKMQCMEFLSLGFISSFRQKLPLTPVYAYRSVLLSLRYGIHETTAISLAVYAMTLCGLHIDVNEGYRYGRLALEMADRSNSPKVISLAYLLVGGGCLHWTHPISESLQRLEYGGNLGVETGYVGFALQSMWLAPLYMLICGRKLSVIKSKIADALKLARLYHQHTNELVCLFLLQVIHAYQGKTASPCKPSGTLIDFEESLREVKETHDQVIVIMHYMYTCELSYIHGDIEEAGKMADLCWQGLSGSSPSPTLPASMCLFEVALTSVARARRGIQQSHNVNFARKQWKKFAEWSEDAPSTFLHLKLLLGAELASLEPKMTEEAVSNLYNEAFSHAKRQENQMIMAIARERLGDYLAWKETRSLALDQWKKSADIYEEWGALAKSKMLREQLKNPVDLIAPQVIRPKFCIGG